MGLKPPAVLETVTSDITHDPKSTFRDLRLKKIKRINHDFIKSLPNYLHGKQRKYYNMICVLMKCKLS